MNMILLVGDFKLLLGKGTCVGMTEEYHHRRRIEWDDELVENKHGIETLMLVSISKE
jgi:hypothetical protein